MPKKTKAIKVTDRRQKKAWLRKSKVSKYKMETKEMNKVILIVCEGQTEKIYFDSFPVVTLTVEAIDLSGQAKQKLVESTRRIVHDSDKDYDEIWCVFDMDIKQGAKELSDYDNAIENARQLAYKVAYSNDAFELWFYLHFHYTDEQHNRTFYYKELGKKWDINYVKQGKRYDFCKSIYERLNKDENASQEKAIARARKLYEAQKDLVYHKQNPITLVYLLIELLNENMRK